MLSPDIEESFFPTFSCRKKKYMDSFLFNVAELFYGSRITEKDYLEVTSS